MLTFDRLTHSLDEYRPLSDGEAEWCFGKATANSPMFVAHRRFRCPMLLFTHTFGGG